MTNFLYQDFLDALAKSESGGRYNIENWAHYLGKYQMGEGALVDSGYFKSIGNPLDNVYSGSWTGKNGATSKNVFLTTPKIQESAIRDYMKVQWRYLNNNGSTSYIGLTINGIKITPSGLLGASHLVGQGSVKTYLKTNGKVIPKDGNGVSLEIYLKKFSGYETPFANHQSFPKSKLINSSSKTNVGERGGNDYSTSKTNQTTPKTAKDFYNPNTQKVNYGTSPKGSNYGNNQASGGVSKQPPIVLQPQSKNNPPSTPNNKIISAVLINAPTRGSIGILPTNNNAGQTLYYEMKTDAKIIKGSITGPAASTSESASSLYVSNVGGSNFWQSTAKSVKSVAKDLISTAAWAANIYFMGVQFASLLKLLVKGTLSAKERLRIGFFSVISNVVSWLFRW